DRRVGALNEVRGQDSTVGNFKLSHPKTRSSVYKQDVRSFCAIHYSEFCPMPVDFKVKAGISSESIRPSGLFGYGIGLNNQPLESPQRCEGQKGILRK
ncbi:MAG: hypothetical protein KJS91_04340, partial [Planctomycetes bacterium]|nr:hypothetical protein [Planctomycetota bacterium]